ncbi:MAG TPA: dTMP kinase [Candidatus Aerophobetes bacterium]|uniref:Thymidylate kinase n=1 Tax=Aerophobetes bacterium TaxID=2030807 RepID=A0A7V5HZI1_UNCAE|nr:dTMP kinase [Candidatus Aerophobetes bacterium]
MQNSQGGKILFISFEGIDKSGKTTQVRLLATFLTQKKYKVEVTKEPGGTFLGNKVKKIILRDENIENIFPLAEFFLYLVDRVHHVEEVIKPALKENKIVISDRYADASVAYQGYGRGIDIEFVKNLNRIATQGIEPDITFLLDIEPEKALLREKRGDRIERENLDFHRKVREGYLKIAKLNPERFKVIRAELPLLEIHNMIKNVVLKELAERGKKGEL